MQLSIAHVSDFDASGSWFDEATFEAGVQRVNDTAIATTDTFCSRKTNCGQSFNHIEIDGEHLAVTNVDVMGGARRTLSEWRLPTHPLEVSR